MKEGMGLAERGGQVHQGLAVVAIGAGDHLRAMSLGMVPSAGEAESLRSPKVEQSSQALGGLPGLEVGLLARPDILRGQILDCGQSSNRFGGGIQRISKRLGLHRALPNHRGGVAHADQRIAHDHVAVQVCERQARHERGQPQREGGDLRSHGAAVHTEHAVLENQPPQQCHIGHLGAAEGTGTQPVDGSAHHRERIGGQERHRLVRQLLGHLNQEVRAATRRVQHREVEQVTRGSLGVGLSCRTDQFQMLPEGGPHGVAHQMLHQRSRCVVHAPGFAAPLVGEPQQRSVDDIGLGLFRHVAVGARVVAQRTVGNRKSQTEQCLVDVAQVTDLQRRVVDTVPSGHVTPDGQQHSGEVGISELQALQQLGALEIRGSEQRTVVGGHPPGRIAVAQGAHQDHEALPERIRLHAQLASGLVGLSHQLCEGLAPVRLVVHGQEAGALGIQHKKQPEQQGQRGPLQLEPLSVLGGVETVPASPVVEPLGQRRKGLLADGVVETLAQFGPECSGLGLELGQAAVGQIGGGQHCQVGAVLCAQQVGVEVQPLAGAGRRVAVEQPVAVVARHDPVTDPMTAAVGGEQPLGGAAHVVDSDKMPGRGPGVDHGHGSTVETGKVPAPPKLLDLVSHARQQRLPIADHRQTVGGLAGLCPALGVGAESSLQRVVGQQPVNDLAPAGKPNNLAGQVPDGIEVVHGGGGLDSRGQLGAVNRTNRLVVSAGTESADALGMVRVVDHQQIAEVHLVGVLPPAGSQAALAGLLCHRDLNLVDPHRAPDAGAVRHLPGNTQPHQPVEQIVGVHRPQLYTAPFCNSGVCKHGFPPPVLWMWEVKNQYKGMKPRCQQLRSSLPRSSAMRWRATLRSSGLVTPTQASDVGITSTVKRPERMR